MSTKTTRIAILAFALAIAGSQAHAANDEYAAIHSVAVVSAVGQTLAFQKVGFMVFGNSENTIPIADWHIDQRIEHAVEGALKSRFTIRDLPIDRSAFKDCDNSNDCSTLLPRTDAVDAYVIVHRAWYPAPDQSNQNIEGLGLFHHLGTNKIFAIYGVDVVNAHSGKRIDYGSARLSTRGLFGADPPEANFSLGNWPHTAKDMTDFQKDAVKTAVLRLIKLSLPHALKNARLPSKIASLEETALDAAKKDGDTPPALGNTATAPRQSGPAQAGPDTARSLATAPSPPHI